MVAFSLRTRDPAVARRLGMRLNLMSHEWSEKMDQGMLLPANIEQLMRGYAEREDYLRLERFRVDMEAPVPAQFASKEALFRERATQDRIFARLYQIAREEGPICQFSDALAAKLAIEGFSTFERDKICQRIENGYVRSLLEPKETGIGMPPVSLVDDVLQSTATPVTHRAIG